MLEGQLRVRRVVPLLGGIAALYLGCWFVIRAGVLAHAPHVLAGAVTVDLTLSATLAVWWFGVRAGVLPRQALLATAAIGFGVAMIMLPQARGMHLRVLGYGWAALEVGALVALLSRVRRVQRETGEARRAGAGLPEALERGVASALSQRAWVARVIANELCVVLYGVCGWFGQPGDARAGERVWSHPGLAQWRALLVALGLLIAGEGLASHVLLSMWSETVAWVWTASEAYVLFWLVGDYQLLRLNPLRLTVDALHVELGLRGRVVIPRCAIAAVRSVRSVAEVDGVVLKLIGEPDVVIELNTEVEVLRGLKVVRCRAIGLRVGALADVLRDSF